jgi:hypothetical protein
MALKKRVGKRKSTLINFIKHTIKSGVSNMNSADAPACMPIVALEKNSNFEIISSEIYGHILKEWVNFNTTDV